MPVRCRAPARPRPARHRPPPPRAPARAPPYALRTAVGKCRAAAGRRQTRRRTDLQLFFFFPFRAGARNADCASCRFRAASCGRLGRIRGAPAGAGRILTGGAPQGPRGPRARAAELWSARFQNLEGLRRLGNTVKSLKKALVPGVWPLLAACPLPAAFRAPRSLHLPRCFFVLIPFVPDSTICHQEGPTSTAGRPTWTFLFFLLFFSFFPCATKSRKQVPTAIAACPSSVLFILLFALLLLLLLLLLLVHIPSFVVFCTRPLCLFKPLLTHPIVRRGLQQAAAAAGAMDVQLRGWLKQKGTLRGRTREGCRGGAPGCGRLPSFQTKKRKKKKKEKERKRKRKRKKRKKKKEERKRKKERKKEEKRRTMRANRHRSREVVTCSMQLCHQRACRSLCARNADRSICCALTCCDESRCLFTFFCCHIWHCF